MHMQTDTLEKSEIKPGLVRPVEAAIALAGLVITAPILGLASLGILVTSRGGVLFRQTRVGRDGKRFTLYKLRTMRAQNSGPQVTASDDRRVTTIGKVLRKTKLDELPELWNILIGDMSLVGPRPEVPRYVDLDNPMWTLVLKSRPGITDPMTLRLRNEEMLLAQVDGDRERFYLETLQPFKLDGYVDYLQMRSWRSDLKVIVQTAIAVILPGTAPVPTLDEISAGSTYSVEPAPQNVVREI